MQNRVRWLLLTLPLGFLLMVLVAPSLRLLAEADRLSWLQPWTEPYLRGRIVWTFAQAALTCGLGAIFLARSTISSASLTGSFKPGANGAPAARYPDSPSATPA